MAYGSLKIDTLIYDNSGSDVSLSVSGIPSSAAINAKAPLASPTFTGTVTIPSGASIAGYATTASLSSYATTASPAFTSDIELSAQAPLKFMDGDSSPTSLLGPALSLQCDLDPASNRRGRAVDL